MPSFHPRCRIETDNGIRFLRPAGVGISPYCVHTVKGLIINKVKPVFKRSGRTVIAKVAPSRKAFLQRLLPAAQTGRIQLFHLHMGIGFHFQKLLPECLFHGVPFRL